MMGPVGSEARSGMGFGVEALESRLVGIEVLDLLRGFCLRISLMVRC